MERRSIELERPIDLAHTCGPLGRGPRDPTHQISANDLWRASNTPDGPATVHVTIDPRARRATTEAWGIGARWAVEHAADLIGANDDGEVETDNARVAAALAATTGLRIGATRSVSDVALATVVDQRVTGIEAKRTWFALVRRLGEPAPGPRPLRVPPHAEQIAALGDYERRRYGLEGRRGAALVAVARESCRLQRAADVGSPTLQRALRALPGIGGWTAAIVAQLVCGDADAVAVGDWHLPRLVGWALADEPRSDDRRMLELLEPFRPQRGRVVRMLVHSGSGPPRVAPRAEIPDLVGREFRGDRDYRVRRTLRFERS